MYLRETPMQGVNNLANFQIILKLLQILLYSS